MKIVYIPTYAFFLISENWSETKFAETNRKHENKIYKAQYIFIKSKTNSNENEFVVVSDVKFLHYY